MQRELCLLHPQALPSLGEVSTLPKERKVLLVFIPEFCIGHLGWRGMNLSLKSVSTEISAEWRPTSVGRMV